MEKEKKKKLEILVVEDRPEKIEAAKKYFNSQKNIETDYAMDLKTAEGLFKKRHYDELITDMFFPEKLGSKETKEGKKLFHSLIQKARNTFGCGKVSEKIPHIMGEIKEVIKNKDNISCSSDGGSYFHNDKFRKRVEDLGLIRGRHKKDPRYYLYDHCWIEPFLKKGMLEENINKESYRLSKLLYKIYEKHKNNISERVAFNLLTQTEVISALLNLYYIHNQNGVEDTYEDGSIHNTYIPSRGARDIIPVNFLPVYNNLSNVEREKAYKELVKGLVELHKDIESSWKYARLADFHGEEYRKEMEKRHTEVSDIEGAIKALERFNGEISYYLPSWSYQENKWKEEDVPLKSFFDIGPVASYCEEGLEEYPLGLIMTKKAEEQKIPYVIATSGERHQGLLGFFRYFLEHFGLINPAIIVAEENTEVKEYKNYPEFWEIAHERLKSIYGK